MVSLLTTFRARPALMQWEQGEWVAASPRPARPVIPMRESDLDADGQRERIAVSGGRVTVLRGADLLWVSPLEWNVTMAEVADLNRDHQPEIVMLVWRPFAPWPVDAWLPYGGRIENFHDAENRSCHIILWGWAGNAYRELWAGSALAEPVLAFRAADWNADGREELAAVESAYDHPEQGGALTLWEWNGFGFILIDRRAAQIGEFAFLVDGNGIPFLLVGSSS